MQAFSIKIRLCVCKKCWVRFTCWNRISKTWSSCVTFTLPVMYSSTSRYSSVTLAYMVYSFYREKKKKVSWAQSQVVVQLYSCTPRYCLKSLGSVKKKKLPKESGKTSAYQIRPVLCQWNNQHWLCDTITSRFKFESSEKQHTRNVIIA